MTAAQRPKLLITGATGQVGSRTIGCLSSEGDVEIVAAVRSPAKAASFASRGITTVLPDVDDESTHLPALDGIDRLLVVTGYTVDMLRQSKALLDNFPGADDTFDTFPAIAGREPTRWAAFIERHKGTLKY